MTTPLATVVDEVDGEAVGPPQPADANARLPKRPQRTRRQIIAHPTFVGGFFPRESTAGTAWRCYPLVPQRTMAFAAVPLKMSPVMSTGTDSSTVPELPVAGLVVATVLPTI